MRAVVETKMLVWIILLVGVANRSQGGAPQAARRDRASADRCRSRGGGKHGARIGT